MLVEIIGKIKNLMNNIDYYTCILIRDKNHTIESSNFQITSCEQTEIYKIILRVFHKGKKYISTKIGINDLEDFIDHLKKSLEYIPNNDYVFTPHCENKDFFLNYEGYDMKEEEMLTLVTKIHHEIKNNQVIESCTLMCNRHYKKYTFDNKNNMNYEKKYETYLYTSVNIEENKKQENYGTSFFPITEFTNIHHEIKNISDVVKKKINIKSIPNDKYEVIFNRNTAVNFVEIILEALDAKNINNKNTFLINDLNKKVFCESINIIEDPHLGIFNDSYADDDFVTIKKKYLVEKGIIKTFVSNSEHAFKLATNSTGNCFGYDIGVTNIYLENGNCAYEELLQNTKKGLLVDVILGDGFNSSNGLISVGVKGFFIENGVLQYAINGTISGEAKEVLQNVLLANDLLINKRVNSPSMKIFNMNFSNLD